MPSFRELRDVEDALESAKAEIKATEARAAEACRFAVSQRDAALAAKELAERQLAVAVEALRDVRDHSLDHGHCYYPQPCSSMCAKNNARAALARIKELVGG